MTSPASLDYAAAHRYFAAACFNRTWEMLDVSARSPEDDEALPESE